MKRSPFLLIFLGALAVPARSHFLWATLDSAAKTVSVGLQETPGEEPLPLAARAASVSVRGVGVVPVSLRAEGNWLRGSVSTDVVGASLEYGVLDRRGAGRGRFLLRYYAKAASDAQASQKSVGLPIELTATTGKDGTMVTVLRNGKPAVGAEVVVEAAEGKTMFQGRTSPLGTVTLPRISVPLAVRAEIVENVKGKQAGLEYDLIRSYSTLHVGQAPAPKTFSRILHDSFGDNHDVVSHTGFIETVMAGKLTKAQLVDHLQQRALVHDELHRILNVAQGVPYGDAQRDVLTLLFGDLVKLGSGWPRESEAWPLTRDFLKEIEASRAKGPYFALGVLHVYYGGITNGGRDIGAMIANEVNISPTYYLKSDGYMDYLKRLNAMVDDPAARKEAVRGGQAAYRYIIAINNAPEFKAK